MNWGRGGVAEVVRGRRGHGGRRQEVAVEVGITQKKSYSLILEVVNEPSRAKHRVVQAWLINHFELINLFKFYLLSS